MSWNPFVHFLTGVLGFGLVQAAVYFFLMVTTIDWLWECGNSYLNDRSYDAFRFISLAILATAQFIIGIKFLIHTKYKFAGVAGLLTNLFTIYLILLFEQRGIFWDDYYQEFTKEQWLGTENKRPMKMIRYMINYNYLKDRSKTEVIQLLGPNEIGYFENDENMLGYYTEDLNSPLVVTFTNDSVSNYYLTCLD